MTQTPAWLSEPILQQLFNATRTAGGELRVVGGAVRDHLLGLSVNDIDFASSLAPEQTIQIAAMHGWKCIPTGIAHGTVTVILPNRSVEITTLRRDIATDGRHAKVAFTDDFAVDAKRRDFTINAMSMDAQGTVYDTLNSQADLQARRIVFIGDAATRITEDGLRILRFFRFLASHGQPPADPAALAAITELSGNLSALSGERIAIEMKKLLRVPNPFFALQQMHDCAVDRMIANNHFLLRSLETLLQHEAQHGCTPNPWVRLLAMIAPAKRSAVAVWITERWKLSRAERDMLASLSIPITSISEIAAKEWVREESLAIAEGRIQLALVDGIADSATAIKLMHAVQQFVPPPFPLTAHDLIARGFVEGKALGDQLRTLESTWIASDYQLTASELLAQMDRASH